MNQIQKEVKKVTEFQKLQNEYDEKNEKKIRKYRAMNETFIFEYDIKKKMNFLMMIQNKIMLQNRYNKNDVKNENQNSYNLS